MRATWATWAMVCGGVLLAIAAARADEVLLTSGGTIRGQVVSEDEDEVVVRTDSGKVSIPRSKVKEVKRSQRKAAAPEATPEGAPPDEAGGVTLTRVPWREGERVQLRTKQRDEVLEDRLQQEAMRGMLMTGQSDLTRELTVERTSGGVVLGYQIHAVGRQTIGGEQRQHDRRFRVTRRSAREEAAILEPDGREATDGLALAVPNGPRRPLLGSLADAIPAGRYASGQVVELKRDQLEQLEPDLIDRSFRIERARLTFRRVAGEPGCAVFQVEIVAVDESTPGVRVTGLTGGELSVELATARPRRAQLQLRAEMDLGPLGSAKVVRVVDRTWSYPGR